MSNKGEDVKQLFAHLGLDPSSYRDLKGEGDKDEVEGRVGKKRTAPAKPDEPVVDPDAYPPPPRVQQAESAPVPEEPVGSAAPEAVPEPAPTRTEPVVDEIVEPEAEPEAEEWALVDAMPDRWSLLASLGSRNFQSLIFPKSRQSLANGAKQSPAVSARSRTRPACVGLAAWRRWCAARNALHNRRGSSSRAMMTTPMRHLARSQSRPPRSKRHQQPQHIGRHR